MHSCYRYNASTYYQEVKNEEVKRAPFVFFSYHFCAEHSLAFHEREYAFSCLDNENDNADLHILGRDTKILDSRFFSVTRNILYTPSFIASFKKIFEKLSLIH